MKKAEAVLGPMLKQLGLESGVKLARIRRDWPDLFDSSISSHMYPATLAEGELLLNVESPTWIQQFTYFKKEIVRKLASYEIVTVRFRLGKVPKSTRSFGLRRETRQLSAAEVTYVESAVSAIEDAHLREAIRKAMQKSIAADRNK